MGVVAFVGRCIHTVATTNNNKGWCGLGAAVRGLGLGPRLQYRCQATPGSWAVTPRTSGATCHLTHSKRRRLPSDPGHCHGGWLLWGRGCVAATGLGVVSICACFGEPVSHTQPLDCHTQHPGRHPLCVCRWGSLVWAGCCSARGQGVAAQGGGVWQCKLVGASSVHTIWWWPGAHPALALPPPPSGCHLLVGVCWNMHVGGRQGQPWGAGRCQQGVAVLGAGVWNALNLQLAIMASCTAAPWAATPHTWTATCPAYDSHRAEDRK